MVFTSRKELIAFLAEQKSSIGFVPTMGALHEGHASLIQKSASENDLSVVSIFVNPKQFGPNEDYSRYPRSFSADKDLVAKAGAKVIFAPTASEMYPEGFATSISVGRLSGALCGRFRPGHFEGVATVVLLLLNLVSPTRAYFGSKDYQQVAVIKRMAIDLGLQSEIVPVPTVREEDGLALSSRNRYLNLEERKTAVNVPRALAEAAKLFQKGERSAKVLITAACEVLAQGSLQPQYIELVDAMTLAPVETVDNPAVLAVAQYVGHTRLIDNIIFGNTEEVDDLIKKVSHG